MDSRIFTIRWPRQLALLIGVWAGLFYGSQAGLVHADVLLLTNGEVVQGDVVRHADRWVVRQGDNASMTVDELDVEHVGASIHEIYDHLRISNSSTVERIHLAEWCLQHELWDACDELLTELRSSPWQQAKTQQLSARVAEARASSDADPADGHTAPPTQPADVVGPDDLLPKPQLAEFCAFVQPLLLNSCVQCHGPSLDSSFSLRRPHSGWSGGQQLTQANLLVVLAAIESGELLKSCATAHGGAKSAPAARWRHRQMERLTDWVAATASHLNRSAQAPSSSAPFSPQGGSPDRSDPFDPAEFNRATRARAAAP